MIDTISGGNSTRTQVHLPPVKQQSLYTCRKRPLNIRLQIVAYHQGGVTLGTRLLKGIVEELRRGFVDTCIFAEDDRVEIVFQPTGSQLLVLHLVEAVAAHVHPIALASQVVHQFMGTIHHTGLRRAEIQELVTYLSAILHGGVEPFAPTERVAETFHDEVVAFNLPFGILCPKADVRVPIVVVEHFGVIEVLIQMQVLIQLSQSNNGIAVGVVEGVIEVDEKVGVLQELFV